MTLGVAPLSRSTRPTRALPAACSRRAPRRTWAPRASLCAPGPARDGLPLGTLCHGHCCDLTPATQVLRPARHSWWLHQVGQARRDESPGGRLLPTSHARLPEPQALGLCGSQLKPKPWHLGVVASLPPMSQSSFRGRARQVVLLTRARITTNCSWSCPCVGSQFLRSMQVIFGSCR